MARDSKAVKKPETSAGDRLKQGHKQLTGLAETSAEKEKKESKKRKRTKDPTSRDTKDAKPKSKHKRRKKDKEEKLPSAKKSKDGKNPRKKRKRSAEKMNGLPASDGSSDDASDRAEDNVAQKDGDICTKLESASPGREDQLREKKKKKKKEKKVKKSSQGDLDILSTKETAESQYADDIRVEAREKRKKKKEKDSKGVKKRGMTKGHGSLSHDETPGKAPTSTANEKLETSKSEVAVKTRESEPLNDVNGNDWIVSMQNGEHKDEIQGGEQISFAHQILRKASQKRNGYLHGLAAIPLLSAEQVRSMDKDGRHSYIEKSAALSHRLVHLMHNVIVKANEWVKIERSGDLVDIEEALTRDMARFSMFPIARQYVSMTLWRRIQQMTRDHLLASSKIGFGKGYADPGKGEDHGLLLHREGDPDAEFVSYKEAYMKDLVEQHQENLDTLREREQMDETRVRFLLRCLDAGSSLAANLRCLDRKMESEVAQRGDEASIRKENETHL
eukprot:GFKZ01005196.1.p1 GENE.GFKZ01005196.1~~GFKZ01005196.1.p1  ORF type:complete len:503 (+),score=101.45 GFKZ01005196.1:143-1651(+)